MRRRPEALHSRGSSHVAIVTQELFVASRNQLRPLASLRPLFRRETRRLAARSPRGQGSLPCGLRVCPWNRSRRTGRSLTRSTATRWARLHRPRGRLGRAAVDPDRGRHRRRSRGAKSPCGSSRGIGRPGSCRRGSPAACNRSSASATCSWPRGCEISRATRSRSNSKFRPRPWRQVPICMSARCSRSTAW